MQSPTGLREKHISKKLTGGKKQSCKNAHLRYQIYLDFFKTGEKWIFIQAHSYNKSKI